MMQTLPFDDAHKDRVVARCLQKIITARGKDFLIYRKLLEKYLEDDLREIVRILRDNTDDGLLSYAHLCGILVYLGFPASRMKTLVDIMERHGLIRAGRYGQLRDRFGVKKALVQLGYEECPNPDCWRWYDDVCACQKEVMP